MTPIEYVDGIYFKREDKYVFQGLRGAKVRSAVYMINKARRLGYEEVTTVGHRKSPQIHIVGTLCKHYGLKFTGHTPMGELPDAFHEFNIIQHKAGYNNVIASRCAKYAEEHEAFEIPFGMHSFDCIMQTAEEVPSIYNYSYNRRNKIKRIVIPVGSGVNLCGLLLGMRKYHIKVPVIGIVVGMSPERLLKSYGPFGWQNMVELVQAGVPYAKEVKDCEFHGIELDPIYEAKCIPFIKKDDLFWIVGIRNFKE